MKAVFGKLQGESLELGEGLNIIEAPNETGKSTWCSFLLSMLYGMNSRERERAGFIPDKIRYAPWSGAPMSGSIDLITQGREVTITRTTSRSSSPLGEFRAVYTGTGDQVPGLTGLTCGEALLGVSREVFERSALIRQSSLPIRQDAELERRIASLITSGEEGTSYSETMDLLKKQLNRRRHHKTGQLPSLETELHQIQQQLLQIRQLEETLAQTRQQSQELTCQERSLCEELRCHEAWAASQKQQTLDDAAQAARQAEQSALTLRRRIEETQIPENDTIGRLRGAIVNLETTRKNVEAARLERDEASKALLRAEEQTNHSPFAGLSLESAQRSAAAVPAIRPRLWWLPLLLAALGAGCAWFLLPEMLWVTAAAGGAGVLTGLLVMVRRTSGDHKQQSAYLSAFDASTPEELSHLLDDYRALWERREDAQAEADQKSATADALYHALSANEQAILLEIRRFAPTAFDLSAADTLLRQCAVLRKQLSERETAAQKARMQYELLVQQTPTGERLSSASPPSRSKESVEEELRRVRALLAELQSSMDQITGRLHGLGDPADLQTEQADLQEQIDVLEGEYASIHLAMEALESANSTLQTRFSPELGRRAAEIFRDLTDGAYDRVVLDRTFHLSAEPAGDILPRDGALLSAGTIDQLYLAVRLAICDLVLPAEFQAPLILDDTLANFDDQRCRAALRRLKEESRRRQILLFTCHSREGAYFSGDQEVSIQQLTKPPDWV